MKTQLPSESLRSLAREFVEAGDSIRRNDFHSPHFSKAAVERFAAAGMKLAKRLRTCAESEITAGVLLEFPRPLYRAILATLVGGFSKLVIDRQMPSVPEILKCFPEGAAKHGGLDEVAGTPPDLREGASM